MSGPLRQAATVAAWMSLALACSRQVPTDEGHQRSWAGYTWLIPVSARGVAEEPRAEAIWIALAGLPPSVLEELNDDFEAELALRQARAVPGIEPLLTDDDTLRAGAVTRHLFPAVRAATVLVGKRTRRFDLAAGSSAPPPQEQRQGRSLLDLWKDDPRGDGVWAPVRQEVWPFFYAAELCFPSGIQTQANRDRLWRDETLASNVALALTGTQSGLFTTSQRRSLVRLRQLARQIGDKPARLNDERDHLLARYIAQLAGPEPAPPEWLDLSPRTLLVVPRLGALASQARRSQMLESLAHEGGGALKMSGRASGTCPAPVD